MSSEPNCDLPNVIPPGSWLGVFGGGQLGRMFTHAAQRLGYHVAILDAEVNCPAAQVADRHFCERTAGQPLETVVIEMSDLCSAVTLEFENVSADLVRLAGERTCVHPGADFLQICQDRVKEKESLASADFATTPFTIVSTADEVRAAANDLGWPLVLKTTTSGYDGKGQAIVQDEIQAEQALLSLCAPKVAPRIIAEQWINFDAEVSMVTARNLHGQVESYPLFENQHVNHILDVTRCPVSPKHADLELLAKEICRGIAECFDVVGIFCVEFFVTVGGDLLINEIAPRPHNSGHLTIEAFTCSQFEQQVRAICNLPLVPASQIRPAAMANVLGDVWTSGTPNWHSALATPSAHLHLYGKSEPRPGRKMGHLTVLDDSSENAAAIARNLRGDANAKRQ